VLAFYSLAGVATTSHCSPALTRPIPCARGCGRSMRLELEVMRRRSDRVVGISRPGYGQSQLAAEAELQAMIIPGP